MENMELENLIQKNFNDIADVLDNIYSGFYKTEANDSFDRVTEIFDDFNTILNEYIKIDNSLNINLVLTSIKKLVNSIQSRDQILLSDILRFEIQEYLQIMFEYLENN